MDNYSMELVFFKDPSVRDAGNKTLSSIPALSLTLPERCRRHSYSPLFIRDGTVSLHLGTEEPHDRTVPWNGNAGVRFTQPFHRGEHLQMFARCQDGPQHVLLGTVPQGPDAAVPLMTQNRTVSGQFHLRKWTGFRNVQAFLQSHDYSRNWLVANNHPNFLRNITEITSYVYYKKLFKLLKVQSYKDITHIYYNMSILGMETISSFSLPLQLLASWPQISF